MCVSKSEIDYLKLDSELIGRAQHLTELPLVVSSTHGPFIVNLEGREILDFISSACTQNLGFDYRTDPKSGGFPFPYAPGVVQIQYAQKLVGLHKGNYKKKLTFGVCGSEGIDAAIKYCRAYTKRKKIVSFYGDYHGTTFGSCTLTTMPGRMSKSFAPMLPECYSIPFCDDSKSIDDVKKTIDKLIALNPDEIAGVIFESVQGDMGMLPMHPYLMSKLSQLSKKYGFLTVADEIQLAFYRTGPFFSFENYPDMKPDLIVMGKNMGGGIPLSCVIGKAEILDSLSPGEHDFTLAGNSEACFRGLHNLEAIEKLKLSGDIDNLISLVKEHLDFLIQRYPHLIKKVTGLGLAYGLWLKDINENCNCEKAAAFMVKRCYELGLYTQRLSSSWLRIEPQLNLSHDLLDKGFKIIELALNDLNAKYFVTIKP